MIEEDLQLSDEDSELSLLETLDHVLDRGVVIAGEITISVADIDLIFVGLNVLLGSVEAMNRVLGGRDVRLLDQEAKDDDAAAVRLLCER